MKLYEINPIIDQILEHGFAVSEETGEYWDMDDIAVMAYWFAMLTLAAVAVAVIGSVAEYIRPGFAQALKERLGFGDEPQWARKK